MNYTTKDLARAWERGREAKPGDLNPYEHPPHAFPDECPSCPHARHTGFCTARRPHNTAVQCGCMTTTFPTGMSTERCLADADGRPGICNEWLPCPFHKNA